MQKKLIALSLSFLFFAGTIYLKLLKLDNINIFWFVGLVALVVGLAFILDFVLEIMFLPFWPEQDFSINFTLYAFWLSLVVGFFAGGILPLPLEPLWRRGFLFLLLFVGLQIWVKPKLRARMVPQRPV